MSTSSIDDLLLGGGSSSQPNPVESQYQEEPEPIEALESDSPDYGEEKSPDEISPEVNDSDDEETPRKELETDEYGNTQEPENKGIRDRLKKQAESLERKHQAEIDALRAQLSQLGASQQVQKAASDFEYNPDETGDWQQQLASFVKQTVSSMTREQNEAQVRHHEAQAQAEFEDKLSNGMQKFQDFRDVMISLPFEISNPMTLATRAMDDPAAFLYAAAKRQPQELERISKLRDPYAQMAEMGRLEERMRRNKPTTSAPRPLSRTHEDASIPVSQKKSEPTIEDLIAKADAKKAQRMKGVARGARR